MNLKKIDIHNVASIDSLSINFSAGMNIICGPNGIGKTTILECIAQSFSGQYVNILKRRADSDSGAVKAWINRDESESYSEFSVTELLPIMGKDWCSPNEEAAKNLLSFKVARTFIHQPLNAISRDVTKDINNIANENKNGLNIAEVKNWFINRHLFSAHAGSLTETQMHNVQVAKEFFGLLNSDYKFSRVDASSNEIMVNTPAGEILYEYLSSGFKSCLSILFGIVKELEFRFKDSNAKADDFRGVILIDEIELHLHPDWQVKIAKVLTKAFPKAQFIVSTHSPHVIQAAKPNEVIALEAHDGTVFRRELPDTQYGFQGWTIEEVLRDVMGMQDTRTPVYRNTLSQFENAVDEENYNNAKEAYEELNKLLHPENHLRKLLAFQLGALKG
ncbi:recombinase RecF [Pseudomonas sp. BN505]|uniref:AAA family ATPase n=1 Tax=Pseudomonas TaxID=286 RepID=UPI00066A685E|nr:MULTISPECIES: AAA family ATPase [Pseudomonas]MDH4843777.1 recombinase RecF [Pseudomonas sp. BN605]MDH4855295.1 recombinase RecF [Pseudomonas sp. BN505]HEN8727233.1 AAA family ATPase [Pseudomonas putida]